MNPNSIFSNGVLALMITVALAGCGGGGSGDPSPTGGTGTPTTSPTGTDGPQPPAPGNALAPKNYTYTLNAATAGDSFSVTTNWTKLRFTAQLWKTAQCGVLTNDPPAGAATGTAPQVRFTSPSTKTVGPMALGSYNSCDASVNNKIGTAPAAVEVDNEMGQWNIVFNGRGQNVQVMLHVTGR